MRAGDRAGDPRADGYGRGDANDSARHGIGAYTDDHTDDDRTGARIPHGRSTQADTVSAHRHLDLRADGDTDANAATLGHVDNAAATDAGSYSHAAAYAVGTTIEDRDEMPDDTAPKDPNGLIAWRLEKLEAQVHALTLEVGELRVRVAQLAPVEKAFYAAVGAVAGAAMLGALWASFGAP